MKRISFRPHLAVCTAAALAWTFLLPGCGAAGSGNLQPPLPGSSAAASQSAAQQTEAIRTAPPYQDDGKLRILYGNDYSGAIVFRGITPLYEADPNGDLWLVKDLLSGETTHYATNQPQNDQPYQYRLYDSTGQLVYYCGDKSPQALLGDWLLLSEPNSSFEPSFESACRFVNLKTGESRQAPGSNTTIQRLADGGYLMTCWRDSTHPTSYLLDGKLAPVCCYEDVWLQVPYWDHDACGWLLLTRVAETEYGHDYTSSLFRPSDGTELTDYDSVTLVGDGIACLRDRDGSYLLYDLATGQELERGEGRYLYHKNGITIARRSDGDRLTDRDGTSYPIQEYSIGTDGTLVARDTANTAYVYDPAGELLYTQPNLTVNRLGAMPGGRFYTVVYDQNDYTNGHSTLYGPQGVLLDLPMGSQIQQCFEEYFVVYRQSYADTVRYDLYDYDGKLLVGSLSQIPGQPEEFLIPARRGFTIGWMDWAGNWLWSQRVFRSTNDEGDYSWY